MRTGGMGFYFDPTYLLVLIGFVLCLIAQAKVENLSFLTHDALIPDYQEKCILPV